MVIGNSAIIGLRCVALFNVQFYNQQISFLNEVTKKKYGFTCNRLDSGRC